MLYGQKGKAVSRVALVAAFLGAAVTSAAAEDVWSATLTVGGPEEHCAECYGYFADRRGTIGELSDTDFVFGYRVWAKASKF